MFAATLALSAVLLGSGAIHAPEVSAHNQVCEAHTGCIQILHNNTAIGTLLHSGGDVNNSSENVIILRKGARYQHRPEVILKFTGHRNRCIGALRNFAQLVLRQCSGHGWRAYGTLWIIVGHHIVSVRDTQRSGGDDQAMRGFSTGSPIIVDFYGEPDEIWNNCQNNWPDRCGPQPANA